MQTFQEHVLNASDCCNNCFAIVRVEREQRESTDPRSVTSVKKSPYTRKRLTTEIDYAPARSPSQSQTVFCRCGLETPFERLWGGEDRCLRMSEFKELLKSCMRALESKGVTLDRQTCAEVALLRYRDDNDVYAAIGAGVESAVQRAAAATSDDLTATISD